MTLYLYKIGEAEPSLTVEDVIAYTADSISTKNGTFYSSLAEGYELSSLANCSEALRASWRLLHPTEAERLDEIETLLASLLFGGDVE